MKESVFSPLPHMFFLPSVPPNILTEAFFFFKQLPWVEGWGCWWWSSTTVAVWNSIVVRGTEENGVINYLVSAGRRKEASSINNNCLSFTMEERACTQHPLTHFIRPPELAAKGRRFPSWDTFRCTLCGLNANNRKSLTGEINNPILEPANWLTGILTQGLTLNNN